MEATEVTDYWRHLSEDKWKTVEALFNVEGRYADYKSSLYKKATKEYARDYAQKTVALRLWIQKKPQ